MRLLAHLDAKMVDFGTPLAPTGVPKGAQNRPSGTKNRNFMKSLSAFFENSVPTWIQGPFGTRLGTTLVDLGWIFDEI